LETKRPPFIPRLQRSRVESRITWAVGPGFCIPRLWRSEQFLASPKLPLRFYLVAGTFEFDRNSGGGDILEGARHLRDVLLAKDIRFTISNSSAAMVA
jgi:hypothetical protein